MAERNESASWTAVRLDADWFPAESWENDLYTQAGVRLISSVSQDAEQLKVELADADAVILVIRKLPKEVVSSLKRCRVITRYGVGTDNIAVEEATARGIPVTNVPHYCHFEVAEQTWAMILTLARRVLWFDSRVRSGEIVVPATPPPGIRRMAGQTLGVVGLGKIGRNVAQRALAFEMKVLAHDPLVDSSVAAGVQANLVDLDRLLAESDVVSLHCPLTPGTRKLIGEKQFKMMKKSAFFINAARGAVVDEPALVRALRERWIAGAGLDVYDPEPPAQDHPLFAMENVVLMPHTSAVSDEAVRDLISGGADQCIKVLNGKRPDFLVNSEVCPWFSDAGW